MVGNKFKVGDRVELIEDYGKRFKGDKGVVRHVEHEDECLTTVTMDDSRGISHRDCYVFARRLKLEKKPFKVGDTVAYNQNFGSRVKGEQGVITALNGDDCITIRHARARYGNFTSSPFTYRVDLVEPKAVAPKAEVTLAPDRYIMETVVATADSIFPRRSFDTILKSLMEEVGELSTEIAIEQGTKKRAASVDGVKGEAIDVFVVAVDMLRAAWGKELCTPAFNEAVIRKLNKWEGK